MKLSRREFLKLSSLLPGFAAFKLQPEPGNVLDAVFDVPVAQVNKKADEYLVLNVLRLEIITNIDKYSATDGFVRGVTAKDCRVNVTFLADCETANSLFAERTKIEFRARGASIRGEFWLAEYSVDFPFDKKTLYHCNFLSCGEVLHA